MGSPDEAAAASMPPNPKAAATPQPLAVAAPPDAPPMAAYSDWSAASMHAYYATGAAAAVVGAPPAAFFPHAAWGGQMMAPYGTPIPYSPMYYAHPSMSGCTAYPNTESERRPSDEKDLGSVSKSKKATPIKSGDGGRGTSGSGYDDATHSGESGSEGSSDTGEESVNPQDSTARRKRTSSNAFPEGEAGAQYGSTSSKASHSSRVAKLPVSAPGRATLPGPTTNLNIGMDVWNAPPGPMKIGPSAANIGPVMPGREGVMPEHQWFQMDERELKREKRKQSNRESARRSRLRKQQECEELAKKVSELSDENSALRVEIEKIKKDFEELQGENFSLMGCLRSKNPDLLTEEERAFVNGHAAVSASKGINGSAPSTTLSIGDDSR